MRAHEMIGLQFGNYTVLKKDGYPYNKKTLYMLCQCLCGEKRSVQSSALKKGLATSCGCKKIVKMVGKKFGRLTVLEFLGSKRNRRRFLCVCECSKRTIVTGPDLRRGSQVSCGCYRNERITRYGKSSAKHGMSKTGVYRSWFAMHDRCYKEYSPSYKWYGAKDVSVCERWKKFENFYEDMGDRPDGQTLDRINPYGNYEPSNCKWSTPLEQHKNRRNNDSSLQC